MQEQMMQLEIAKSLKIKEPQVKAVLSLLAEGNTIPFIARYRKERTGSLDEVQIHEIDKAYQYALSLNKRREEVLKSIQDQGKLDPSLEDQIQRAASLQELEDLYRPYKQKKQTKAQKAIDQGLEPLADWMSQVQGHEGKWESLWPDYLQEELEDEQAILDGVHEILAQRISDRADFRDFIRKYSRYNGYWQCQLKDEAKDPQGLYSIYYQFTEKLVNLAPHQVLASLRAEKEEVISIKIDLDEQPPLQYMERHVLEEGLNPLQKEVLEKAIKDAYQRFIKPSIERELRSEQEEKAQAHAIDVFGDNVRHLLIQPPLKGKTVLGLDPAYRTGCKLAVISATGQVLDKGVIYPHKPASQKQRLQAKPDFIQLIERYQVDVVAIGNGTASRESEQFVAESLSELSRPVHYVIVSEAGASVYSASAIAREEFPDYQVEERSAVSIARRLQDPLAELIKIDPQSMGVGQYQHDLNQKSLTQELDFVVNMTVNQVGVDVNTASIQLLEHVSGMTKATAKNVIDLRNELGHFSNREQIKTVKRLGPKTFEQAAGFLRIMQGDNPLDQTSIHPESYDLALTILQEYQLDLADLGSEEAQRILSQADASSIAERLQVGQETIEDILHGLMNPTMDIRDHQAGPILRSDVLQLEDLNEGMVLEGTVRNVVDFGAFVDIGVKQDGLIHISKLLRKKGQFIKHPSQVLSVGDLVKVEVVSLDRERQRIGLKQLQTD